MVADVKDPSPLLLTRNGCPFVESTPCLVVGRETTSKPTMSGPMKKTKKRNRRNTEATRVSARFQSPSPASGSAPSGSPPSAAAAAGTPHGQTAGLFDGNETCRDPDLTHPTGGVF